MPKNNENFKIGFLIPVFNHNPNEIVKEIQMRYKNPVILIVNDGMCDLILPKNILVINNPENFGLAKSLIIGLSRLTNEKVDYIVRIDPDKEYPIYPVSKLLQKLDYSTQNCGAFVELRRDMVSNGIVDAIFHNVMGFIEGLIIIGKPMIQHSPGLQIYKKDVVINMIPSLNEFVLSNKLRWGLDLFILGLAKTQGNIVSFKVKNHNWRERRSIKKIILQTISAIRIIWYIMNKNLFMSNRKLAFIHVHQKD